MQTTIVRRYDDWPIRLTDYIACVNGAPRIWGLSDCCMFAAGAILAMTGTDLACNFRSAYSTEREAIRIIRREGSLYLLARKIAQQFNIEQIGVLKASRGDVVIVEKEQQAIGIVCLSGDSAWFVTPEGLSSAPLSMCVTAWRI